MPLEIRPLVTLSDFNILTQTEGTAFEPDVMTAVLREKSHLNDQAQITSAAEDAFHQSMHDPNTKHLKVIDTDAADEAVAFATYRLSTGDVQPEMASSTGPRISNAAAPSPAYSKMKRALLAMRTPWIGSRDHLCRASMTLLAIRASLSNTSPSSHHLLPPPPPTPSLPINPAPLPTDLRVLMTSPVHRRRGAASLLLSNLKCLARQYAPKIPIYLISTPLAYPIYAKAGFLELDRHELSPAEYGIDPSLGSTHRVLMIWEDGE